MFINLLEEKSRYKINLDDLLLYLENTRSHESQRYVRDHIAYRSASGSPVGKLSDTLDQRFKSLYVKHSAAFNYAGYNFIYWMVAANQLIKNGKAQSFQSALTTVCSQHLILLENTCERLITQVPRSRPAARDTIFSEFHKTHTQLLWLKKLIENNCKNGCDEVLKLIFSLELEHLHTKFLFTNKDFKSEGEVANGSSESKATDSPNKVSCIPVGEPGPAYGFQVTSLHGDSSSIDRLDIKNKPQFISDGGLDLRSTQVKLLQVDRSTSSPEQIYVSRRHKSNRSPIFFRPIVNEIDDQENINPQPY